MVRNSFFTLLAILFVLGSCKKDKPAAPLTVKGTWKIVTDRPFTFGSYYIFTETQGYVCKTDNENIHYISYGNYQLNGNKLINTSYDGFSNYTRMWEVELKNDTLYLHNVNPYNDVILVKDPTGPATPDNWTKQAKLLTSFAMQDAPGDITWNAGKIYYNAPGFSADKIYVVSTTNGAIIDSIPTVSHYYGIEYNNDKLYVSYGKKVIRVGSTGTEDVVSPDNPNNDNLWHLAATGNGIYAYGLEYLHNYAPGGNSFNSGLYVGSTYSELAYANGYMYIVKDGIISRCTIDFWHAQQSFYVYGYSIRGIAFDGTYFWCTAKNNQTDNTELLKLEL